MRLTARDIARLVDGQLAGNPDEIVTGVAGIKEARAGDISFVAHPRYLPAVKTTRASVILVAPDTQAKTSATLIRVANPSVAFVKVVEHTASPPVALPPGIHTSASVAGSAKLGKNVRVEAFVVIEENAVIGDRAIIGAGSYVGHECRLGDDCRLYPRVTLRERSVLADRVVLHSGVIVGADGFGYNTIEGRHEKIPQVGAVEIGADVEIGANTTIDRGRFGNTRIGRGTKIDNLVQIGHNCLIGEDCIICGQVGMAGTTVLGNRVTLAGQVGIAGHLTIGDGAVVMAQSGIAQDVPAGAMVFGSPAVDHKQYKRAHVAVQKLPELMKRVRELEQQLVEMRGHLDSAR